MVVIAGRITVLGQVLVVVVIAGRITVQVLVMVVIAVMITVVSRILSCWIFVMLCDNRG